MSTGTSIKIQCTQFALQGIMRQTFNKEFRKNNISRVCNRNVVLIQSFQELASQLAERIDSQVRECASLMQ